MSDGLDIALTFREAVEVVMSGGYSETEAIHVVYQSPYVDRLRSNGLVRVFATERQAHENALRLTLSRNVAQSHK